MSSSNWYESSKNYVADAYEQIQNTIPSEKLTDTWNQTQNKLIDNLSDLKEKSADQLPNTFAFLSTENLRHWMDAVYEGSRTQYDRAMDAAFIAKNKAGELGYPAGKHRLFDDGHTLWGSFERAQNAVKGDSEMSEIIEWVQAYMNDLTTPSGMPLVNLDPEQYDQWASAFSETVPGLDEQYLFDMLNFDAMELIAAELSVIGVIFAFSQEDLERISELLGAMGINAMIAANPIMGMITIAVTAYSYWRHEKVEGSGVMKGGAIAGIASVIFLSLGLPILIELVLVIVVGYQLRKRIFESEEFIAWIKNKLKEHSPNPSKMVSVLPDTTPLVQKVRGYLPI